MLYNYVKDKAVGDSTFRELLLPYFENEDELVQIEYTLEALTIFVPSLPENSFSAETWNTSQEVPLVAIRLLNNDKTPIINSEGESFLFDNNVIPGFPVVVLKENERVTVPSFSGYDSNENQEYHSDNGFRFKFSNSAFNGMDPIEVTDGTPEDLIDAWGINGKQQNYGWQRDYLYYTISQANSSGPYISSYSEHLKDFRLEKDPYTALERIADPSSVNSNLSDPSLVAITSPNLPSHGFWTDGAFEFIIYLEYDVNEPPLEKGFPAHPEELFEVKYSVDQVWWLTIYSVTDLETKTLPLELEILPWRLHDYSNEWKLTFEEEDLTVTHTSEESYSSTFNANFNFSTGEAVKVGAEFGASAEQTYTSTITRKWTEESDKLKMAKVKFGENVIIDEGSIQFPIPFSSFYFNYTYYKLRRYTTGWCSFSLVPLKVQ